MFLHRSRSGAARKRSTRLLAEHLEKRCLLAQVGYQIHLLPPEGPIGGPELTSVNVGQSYDLAISVRDLRDNPAVPGVYAGYLDVGYDSSKARVQVGEIQRLRIGPFPAGAAAATTGSFTLKSNGHTTGPIPFSANVNTLAASTQAALAALTGVGHGNVRVTPDILNGDGEFILQVRFLNNLYDRNVANLLVNTQNLTGPTSPQVSLTYEGDLATGATFAFTEAFRSLGASPAFMNGLSAGNQTDLLDDIGAFAGLFSAGAGPSELVRTRMIALAEGSLTFTPSIANRVLPAHDTLVYGSSTGIPAAEIDLGTPKSLQISLAPIVAAPDYFGLFSNSFMPASFDVLANDKVSPETGQTKQLLSVTQPTSGSALISNNRVLYTPAPGFTGTDTFTYTARNSTAGASPVPSTATVTITVVAPTGPLMGYQVHLLPVNGSPFKLDPQNPKAVINTPNLGSLKVGDQYDVVVTAQPTSMSPLGVFAAYTDVTFDGSKTALALPEFQSLSIGPFTTENPPSTASGTFRLNFGGQITSPIEYSSSQLLLASRVQTALAVLLGASPADIEVTSQAGKLQIVFGGRFAGLDQPNLTVAESTLTGPTNPQVTFGFDGDLAGGNKPEMSVRKALSIRHIPTVADLGDQGFFINGPSGGLLPNRLDDIGAFAHGVPTLLTPQEIAAGLTVAPPREIARGRFLATADGEVTFTPDLSQISSPDHDSLLFGISGAISPSQISLGVPKTVTISAHLPYQAVADSATTTEDSDGIIIDVLANDIAPAPSTTKQIVAFAQVPQGVVTKEGQTLKFVPAPNFAGTVLIGYSAKGDTTTQDGSSFVTVTVTPVNDAPNLDPIASLELLEDASLQTVALTGISAGEEGQSLTLTAESSNPALTGNLIINYAAPSAAATLAFIPTTNAFGTATITVTLQDNGGTTNGGVDTVTRTFSVVARPVNDAPTLAAIASPADILEDASLQTILLTGISSGGESQLLSLVATSSNPELTGPITIGSIHPDGSAALTYLPSANVAGTATITVTLQDDGGTADGGSDVVTRSFSLVVLAVNDPPTMTLGENQLSTDESGPQAIANWASGMSAGPGEADQSVTISVQANNAALFATQPAIDASGALTYTPALNASGTAIVSISLADSGTTEHGGLNTNALTFVIQIDKQNLMHNAALPLDATGDTSITAADVLRCVNHLNAFGARPVSADPTEDARFLDVNADGHVTAADPLAVINYLNAFGPLVGEAPPDGGEPSPGAAADFNSLLALLADDTLAAANRKRK